jgi:methionyl-tRNA formyltransferase
MPKNPILVFMGSPEFAMPTLGILSKNYRLVGVVTQPDRPSGRGRVLTPPPVKTLADQLGLPVIQPNRLREPEFMEQLRIWSPDLIVVAAFGQILRPDVLELPPQGCINVHASLLPRWRGAAPIQAAIRHGDQEAGVTIMKMDSGVDTGPMLAQRAIPIQPDDTAGRLAEKLSTLGAELLSETLPRYLSGELHPRPQPEAGASYAPMLKKEDARLDFSIPAEGLARYVRAYNPSPGAYFEWAGEMLKVHRAHATEGESQPGRRQIHQKLPAVGTSHGLLVLDEVQPPGKKPMPGKAFLSGARNWVE